jgi:hypothetical protein
VPDEYANETCTDSKRVLPNFYNGPFDKRDRRAVKTLDDIVSQSRYFGKKR